MNNKNVYGLILAAVVIAVAAFYVGAHYAAQVPGMTGQKVTAAPVVPAPSTPTEQPVYGTIESASASNITLQIEDGTTQQFSISASTQISEGTALKQVSDLSVGTAVMVASVPGSSDAAQYIQILPPPPSH